MRPQLYVERRQLTGRTRLRPALFGTKLVLQVEECIETAPVRHLVPVSPPPDCIDITAWYREQEQRAHRAWKPSRTQWRDATWQDHPHHMLKRHV